ncbi:MAG: hypothetical protein SFZ23_04255 [Planctomycetota bacterium]|nr:hypothetical protein [Planctomycetota bacterium]
MSHTRTKPTVSTPVQAKPVQAKPVQTGPILWMSWCAGTTLLMLALAPVAQAHPDDDIETKRAEARDRAASVLSPIDPASPRATIDSTELPSLDELLGIAREGEASPQEAARAELDRQLSPEQVADEFRKTVALMDESADRLEGQRDVGLATQRLQEEVVRRLDRLIAQAEQNAKQSQSRQRRSQSQQQQQQQQQQRQSSRQARAQQQQQQAASASESEDNPNPAGQAANPRALTASAGATWGNLPAHTRATLLEGLNDRYSSLYRSLTEDYYRRLAEEPKR